MPAHVSTANRRTGCLETQERPELLQPVIQRPPPPSRPTTITGLHPQPSRGTARQHRCLCRCPSNNHSNHKSRTLMTLRRWKSEQLFRLLEGLFHLPTITAFRGYSIGWSAFCEV